MSFLYFNMFFAFMQKTKNEKKNHKKICRFQQIFVFFWNFFETI